MIFEIQPIIQSVYPFEYCEIQHRDRNSEPQIAKKRTTCYWKDHPTSEKKTLEMYISPNSAVLLICFFCRKKKHKNCKMLLFKIKPKHPGGFMAPHSSHWGSTTTNPLTRLQGDWIFEPWKTRPLTSNPNSRVSHFFGFLVYLWIDAYFHFSNLLVYVYRIPIYVTMYLSICLSIFRFYRLIL